MKKQRTSVDGFIPRRSGGQIGDLHETAQKEATEQLLHTGESKRTAIGEVRDEKLIGSDEIDESLRSIDDNDQPLDKKAKKARRKRDRRRMGKVRRIITIIAVVLLVSGLGAAGYLVWRAINAGESVFQGSFLDLVQNEPLKEDANGRTNFLVFGTAEDSEGGTHGGANLTDSILVASIDQDKKDAYLLSLPRDLWVAYEAPCTVGFQGKLNAAYFCGSNDGENEKAGAEVLSRKVAEITGLEIQYYVHLNFTAVVEAVDAVGGVEVTIESDDPRGILDRNFDWKCNYTCYYVNYENGETVQLDGERALALARARNAAGGYGLPGGNFDREKNQQKIITALREKAVSAGTLTNLGAVTGLIDALGNNLRTNIATKEIRTLMSLGTEIKTESIISLSLVEEGDMLVTTGNLSGQSIVRPVAGLLDYSAIIEYVNKNVNSTPVSREAAQTSVLNGGAVAGLAQTEADKLEELGFIIDEVNNAPDGTYDAVEIYQIGTTKTASAAKLAELYNVTIKTTPPPFSVVGETDFVIILGTAQ